MFAMEGDNVDTDDNQLVGSNPSSETFAKVGPGGEVRNRLYNVIMASVKNIKQVEDGVNKCGYKAGKGGDKKKDSFTRKDIFSMESIDYSEMSAGLMVIGSGETLNKIKAMLYLRLRKGIGTISVIEVNSPFAASLKGSEVVGVSLPVHTDIYSPEKGVLLPWLLNGGDGKEFEKYLTALIKAVMTEWSIIIQCLLGINTHSHRLNFRIATPGLLKSTVDGANIIYSLWITSHDTKSFITLHRDIVLKIDSYDRQDKQFTVYLGESQTAVATLQTIAPMIANALKNHTLESSALEILEQRIDRLLEFNN